MTPISLTMWYRTESPWYRLIGTSGRYPGSNSRRAAKRWAYSCRTWAAGDGWTAWKNHSFVRQSKTRTFWFSQNVVFVCPGIQHIRTRSSNMEGCKSDPEGHLCSRSFICRIWRMVLLICKRTASDLLWWKWTSLCVRWGLPNEYSVYSDSQQ